MAKILSQVDTVRRGSVGGITYTANRYAAIVARARTVPVNPNTGYQSTVREIFKHLCGDWVNSLDQEDRDSWVWAASYHPYEGPLGTYHIPGRNYFIAVKMFRNWIHTHYSGALGDALKWNFGGGWESLGTIVLGPKLAPGKGFSVAFSRTAGNADLIVSIQMSLQQPASVSYFKGPFLPVPMVIDQVPGGVTTALDVETGVAPARFFIKIRGIDEDTGTSITREMILPVESQETAP